MRRKPTSRHGFSLAELLVVLVIAGVLAAVGVSMIGNRGSAATRAVLDELEGTLAGAHQFAVATGSDVLVATHGEWSATNPLILAYDNATLSAATIISNGRTRSESFRVAVVGQGLQREHMHAGIVTNANAAWWTTATAGLEDITTVLPFTDSALGFQNILSDATKNLFQGGSTDNSIRISGTNKRFTSTFWIQIVSLRNGQPIPGGPVGLVVGQANGGTIYKFYNPGVMGGGQGKWRRI